MAIPVSELQKLNPSARIELFVLELVEGLHYATGNPSNVPTVYRFHAGSNMNSNAEIVWQGNSYQRVPITFTGAEFTGKGQVPRPTLSVANLGGITRSGSVITMTDLLIIVNLTTPHNDLINASNQYNVEMLINKYPELSHTEIMFVYPDEFLNKIVPFFKEKLN